MRQALPVDPGASALSISRRAVLSTVPAAGLLAVARPLQARAATSPVTVPADPAAAHALLRDNTIAVLAGTAASNARPEVGAKLTAIDATARSRLDALDGAGPGELFRGVPLGTSEANLTTSFQYLYEIALATRTPGGTLGDTVAVRRQVLDGLGWLHDNHYGDQSTGYYGNWHHWEIGISSHVSRTLVLLAADLAGYRPELAGRYVATMDGYLRNGRDGDVDLDSRFHTGADGRFILPSLRLFFGLSFAGSPERSDHVVAWSGGRRRYRRSELCYARVGRVSVSARSTGANDAE